MAKLRECKNSKTRLRFLVQIQEGHVGRQSDDGYIAGIELIHVIEAAREVWVHEEEEEESR